MPELPEVETVKEGLNQLVKGSHVNSIDILYPKMINVNPEKLKVTLTNQNIKRIDRRGKYLLFRFSNDMTLVSHLRMEGKYDVEPEGTEPTKHTHVIFHLNDDRELRYKDSRKFGRMYLIKNGDEHTLSGLGTIGPEPTEDDLTFDYMKSIMNKGRGKIKPFLLNQSHIAGLGNIYCDEVLWLSKIHPETITNTISDNQIMELRKNIIEEIKMAIKGHGTTVHSYSNAYGEAGQFQNSLHVYGRAGEPCERCGTNLEKIKVAQRGTTFCPNCQHKVTKNG
ncbi:bifunctional DNA-formamidopyrimidine glycosylase/DNA-(apurinic or apyrimidinic site) lyase [Apilactobacillus timberlakei]|uniref:Formamidopyrimidine-DNA glycosylase n=1 Tax=Apilactobacillus timberlakei TaxID=2008380 RepID=A0ABY2YVS0_9LACO|nr:bifunctional DNA-formamidopyrimidine glycosylase/DNA-(apurinic or apyrimidinic site) lyase [Apilactobacillus timberlakei]TPR14047.1 bifunctional DNA-formamidopyrimidine glycosylase/DNA-(apurinic or apyrimidinic site) lyase [Apilactobacillus timberlakei]TPR15363.1 bifunctional DNA-formamidopyrimidine glycosylase/DNA-(apurinic or apyrimidinic site) lyase [Apilactobacillus timberlakei]TPR17254.1 bifunctional DNA-formamidopyrimidine glycosylase/DNA-(apurinic or apyrimidinic site) lyase [Apilactob